MTKVTRDVITDLWPLCTSGDASPDSRALVEAFLAQDPDLGRMLRAEPGANPLASVATPPLKPDHEMKTLERVQRRLRGPYWLMRLALVFSCLAFGRIVSDTSWNVSPRQFIATAAVAAAFWVAFLVVLFRGRKSILVRLR